MTANDKYLLWDCENLHIPIKTSNAIIFKTKKFLQFLSCFWNLNQILKILKEKMIVIANVFPKLQTVKDLVRPCSKKCRFRTPFDSQYIKASPERMKSAWKKFYHIFFSPVCEKLICKISPLVICEILVWFGKTLTANEKYLVRDCENLPSPFQMELSQKRKTFLQFFFHFWNLHQMRNILKKKMIVIADLFPKLQTVKDLVRAPSKKCPFRTPFENQHVKGS